MKLKFSIALNVLLVVTVAWLGHAWFSDAISHHYYREQVGFLLHGVAEQNKNGSQEVVQMVLSELPQPPTYKELGAAMQKLEQQKAHDKGQGKGTGILGFVVKQYSCPQDYLRQLTQIARKESADPLDQVGPSDTRPSELLGSLHFQIPDGASLTYSVLENQLIYAADPQSQEDLLALHRKIGIPIQLKLEGE